MNIALMTRGNSRSYIFRESRRSINHLKFYLLYHLAIQLRVSNVHLGTVSFARLISQDERVLLVSRERPIEITDDAQSLLRRSKSQEARIVNEFE